MITSISKSSVLIVSLFALSVLSTAPSANSLTVDPVGGNTTVSETTNYCGYCDEEPGCGINKSSQCDCTIESVKSSTNCILCVQTGTPKPGLFLFARLALDELLEFCHHDGYNVDYQLELPPAAQVVYDHILRLTADLRLQQKIFLALQIIGGHIGLVITVLFTLSQSAHRDLTFFSFCITWIISSVVYSISLYKGIEHHRLDNPLDAFDPQGTRRCDIQAILVAGSQIMTAGSTMTLVLQLLLNLHSAIYAEPKNALKPRRWITLMLVALPYGGFAFGSLFSYLLIY